MKTIQQSELILLVNGIAASGFDESDSVIIADRFNDSANHKIGLDGEMTLFITNDRSGYVEFTLMQGSDFHNYLLTSINAQENGAFIPQFVQFKDGSTGEIISGTQAYINRPSPARYGNAPTSRTWRIVCERLDILPTEV